MRAVQKNQYCEIDLRGLRLTLWLRTGSKPYEPAAGAKAFGWHRRSRLAHNIKWQRIEMSAARRAVAHSSGHALSDYDAVPRRDFDRRAFDWIRPAVACDTRLQQMPAVH